uniref:Uncharacterized protein n=1 Tax=Daucus carota subsp. sativus TaxID=79200 RepID=A0A166CKH5_DAUCS
MIPRGYKSGVAAAVVWGRVGRLGQRSRAAGCGPVNPLCRSRTRCLEIRDLGI